MSVANPRVPTASIAARELGVIVFAKAPVVGHCKTRLARGVGRVRAARLYLAMLEHCLNELALRLPAGRLELACSPTTHSAALRRLARRYGARRLRQHRGDLGRRMAAALADGLRRHPKVVLIGADQPALAGDWLTRAEAALDRADGLWLAPTLDGGYWSIGLARPCPRLFRGPAWGGTRVARQTRTLAAARKLAIEQGSPLRDIDEPRDWQQTRPNLRQRLGRLAAMPGQPPGVTRSPASGR